MRERQEQRDEQITEHQAVERQIEGVEPEVFAELRIMMPKFPPCRNSWIRTQYVWAIIPASSPMTAGIPMPNTRSRANTTLRYRATGSLPLLGTNTGRLR